MALQNPQQPNNPIQLPIVQPGGGSGMPPSAFGTPPAVQTPQNTYLPPGQNPLSGDVPSQWGQGQWQGAGGGSQAQQYYAWQDFAKTFGRNPTQSELDMLSPSYASGDPNKTNNSAGKAQIAAYYNSQANSPTNIAAGQQQQAIDSYKKDSTTFDNQTNQIFQQSLGRNATSDEAQHFGALLASGQVDSYGLGQLVGQSQEAQQRQTQTYQDTLSKNLQGTQGDYFKNYIEPSILAQSAASGRDVNSSGVQQAEVQAGKQQNYDLQNYLAQFGAGQYGQSAANQQNVYQQYLGNLYGLQNANVNSQLAQQNYLQNQNTNIGNFQMQQNAYNAYLNQYGKRSNGMGSLIGGIAGGALGSFGGPAGAAAGYGIGSSIGGAAQGGGNQMYQNPMSYGGLSNSWSSFGSNPKSPSEVGLLGGA